MTDKPKSVWITGCAGFLGSYLAQAFSTSAYQVVGFSRRPSPYAHHSIRLDLASDQAPGQFLKVIEQLGRPDVVVHAASLQPGPFGRADYVKANVLTTANLLDGLEECPSARVILTSTLSVYGGAAHLPVKETAATNGRHPYALTKRFAERLIEGGQKASVVVLRLPSLYGVGQQDSFIDGLAKLAMNNEKIELYARGELIRDVLHVDDVVDAILACAAAALPDPFYCFNVGCGRAISTREYAEALVEALDSTSPIIPVDRPAGQQTDLYLDITSARRLLGFEPSTLEASMVRYAQHLKSPVA